MLDGGPDAAIFDITTKFLKAKRVVAAAKQIDTAIVILILDAVDHGPRLINSLGHGTFN